LQAADDRGGGGGTGADAEEFLREELAGGAVAVIDLNGKVLIPSARRSSSEVSTLQESEHLAADQASVGPPPG